MIGKHKQIHNAETKEYCNRKWRKKAGLATGHSETKEKVAARPGLEPRQTEPESVVLPLHHRAKI